MAIKKHKPTSPGRRFSTWLRPRRGHPHRAREVARRGPDEDRRAQHLRAHHLAATAAAAPSASTGVIDFKRAQGRRARQGRRDRVRPQPHRPHRAAPLRRRREALHPGAAAARAWACTVESGRAGRHPGRQLPAAARDPHRHRRPQRRAHARPRRPARPLRRHRHPAGGEGGRATPRCACRRARCAWCEADCRATIGHDRQRRPRERRPSARPDATATRACARRRAARP